MTTSFRPIVLAACLLTAAADGFAQPVPQSQPQGAGRDAAPAASTQPVYTRALGIAMEEWDYPFPVRFLDRTAGGERAKLAYMDVPPTDPTAAAAAAGGAPVVVLLHGKNFYGSYWDGTIRALTAAGFRLVVPDQLGFGKSSKPDAPYSFDGLAADTVALLDHLGVERFAVVGHSMGGMLAVRVARNYPDRVTRLALENPIGLEDYRMHVPPRTLEQAYASELAQTPEKVRDYFRTYFVAWRPEYERLVEPPARITLSGEFPRWARASALTYLMIYQQPVRHEFPLIGAPTLLVIGQEDRTVVGRALVPPDVLKTLGNYPELGKSAARDIPDARLVALDGVGHIPHVESPDRFHDALVPFLQGR